jgi:hypothetical protein
MAIGMLGVLSLTAATLAVYSTSNGRNADYSNATVAARNLAEAGEAAARSILWNASDPTNPSAVGSGTVTLEGGTATYSGTLSGSTWTLTGTGSVANPTGGAIISETVTSQVTATPGGPSAAWQYNFADALVGCMDIANNATFTAPLYVRGNLCVDNNAHFTGSSLHVGGTVTVGNNGDIGTASAPIPFVNITGGCTGGLPNPHSCVSGPADDVYAQGGIITQNPGTLTKPPVDLLYWYQNASPGPVNGCTAGSVPGGFDSGAGGTAVPPNPNASRPTFDLTPAGAYSCTTSSGELSWVPGNPGTLTIKGTIFIDGNIQMTNNANAVYEGRATIYSSGTITLSNNARLCGIAGCGALWNPSVNLLVLVAGAATGTGFTISNNGVYQGAAYVVSDYTLVNNAANWGPVIASQLSIANNAGQFVPVGSLPAGAPGASSPATLANVAESYTTQ